MANLDQEIVTGMREPHHTGLVSKPLNVGHDKPLIRRVQLSEGQVEFHSAYRRYRVEFQKPKQQLNTNTGEIIDEGARFLQFEGFRCVTDNPTIIHQAKGCQNIPNVMVEHAHTQNCPKNCKIMRCSLGHVDPKNQTRPYFPPHPSFGLGMDFWDATEMDKKLKKDAKTRFIQQAQQLVTEMPPEDIPEFLSVTGLKEFVLPPKEK
jgi:hypothetical protein